MFFSLKNVLVITITFHSYRLILFIQTSKLDRFGTLKFSTTLYRILQIIFSHIIPPKANTYIIILLLSLICYGFFFDLMAKHSLYNKDVRYFVNKLL